MKQQLRNRLRRPAPARRPAPGTPEVPARDVAPPADVAAAEAETPPNLLLIRYAFLVLPKLGFAYARVPKVASTSIRAELQRHVPHDPRIVRRLTSGPNAKKRYYQKDQFWEEGTMGATTRATAFQMLQRFPDLFCFTFVRDPFDRIVSCYNNKIVENAALASDFVRHGFTKETTFVEFVEGLVDIPDTDADPHFCSQWFPLQHKGRIVPGFIGRQEHMADDWDRLCTEILARTGVRFRPIQSINQRRDRSDLADYYRDPAAVRAVLTRYAADFDAFYPDLDRPQV